MYQDKQIKERPTCAAREDPYCEEVTESQLPSSYSTSALKYVDAHAPSLPCDSDRIF